MAACRLPLLKPYEAELKAMVEAIPDITLAEIKLRFAELDVSVWITAIHHMPRRFGLRHKKVAEGGRAGPARHRPALAKSWRGFQGYIDPERFVFLDETGASTNMVRTYGRAMGGPARPSADHHVRRGPQDHRDRGPARDRPPDDGALFRAYPEQVLAPA